MTDRITRIRPLLNILFAYDVEPLALFFGLLTLAFGAVLLLEIPTTNTTRFYFPVDLMGGAMIASGLLKLVGLFGGFYRVQLVGMAIGILCWSFLAAAIWVIGGGRAFGTSMYVMIALFSAWTGIRTYWDHLRTEPTVMRPPADLPSEEGEADAAA